MESNRKKDSLRFKFLKELDSIVRFPTQVKSRRNNFIEPNKPIIMASVVKPPPASTNGRTGAQPCQTGNPRQSQPSTSVGTTLTGPYFRKTNNTVPVEAVNNSVHLQSTPPSKPGPPVSSATRPFSPNTPNSQVRQQRARRTERVKSIKRTRPFLQTRSSSLFYLEMGEESRRVSNEVVQRRRIPEIPASQRSVSVDDLLETGNYGGGTDAGIDTSPFFASQSQVPTLNPQMSTPSSDLLIFSPVPDAPPPIPLNSDQNLDVALEESNVDVLGGALSRTLQIDETETRRLETPPSKPPRTSPNPTISSRSYYSTVSLDSILNHNEVRNELSRRLSAGTSTRLDATASSQMSLPSTSTSTPFASTGSLILKTSTVRMTDIDTLMSYDRTMDGLKVNEKVVWFTDKDVPQVGLIKWLGKINGKHLAGVEFDNHVGNTSGRWNGRKLFNAVLTRGRFVPITELLLYSDYSQKHPYNAPAKINYPSWERVKSSPEDTPIIICVICQDPLLIVDAEDSTDATVAQENRIETEKNMVTTHCGHLFHHECLTKWFNVKKKPMQPCPYCQRTMQIQDIIRIYPVQGK